MLGRGGGQVVSVLIVWQITLKCLPKIFFGDISPHLITLT